MPTLIRVWRDLGIELGDQTSRLEYDALRRARATAQSRSKFVLQRLVGGWQDYARRAARPGHGAAHGSGRS
jgi:hypothetical protein